MAKGNSGDWVKQHRAIMDHAVWADPFLFQLFSWCVMRAAWKKTTSRGIPVNVGQFITGRNKAAEELHVAPSKWYRGVHALAAPPYECISLEVNSSWTRITVCNYSTYQSADAKSEQQVNSVWTADEQRLNTKEDSNNPRRKEVKTEEPKSNTSSADAEGANVDPSNLAALVSSGNSEPTDSTPSNDDPPAKPLKPTYSATFERWYVAYPRKTGKEKAAASFGRALKRIAASRELSNADALDWLCEVTQRFAASPAGSAGRYTPHPATWLNDGRYDDDPQEWQRHDDNRKTAPAVGPGQRYDPNHQIEW